MTLFYSSLVDPVDLTGYVRDQVLANPHRLEAILPTREVTDLDFELTRGSTTRGNVAKFRAFDTESPIGKRQPISKISGSLPPISQKIPLGEEATLRQRALERGNNAQLVQTIFDDAANQALAVADRMELARGEAINTGSIVLDENGLKSITVDMGRAAGHSVTAAILWTSLTTAVPLSNLLTWEGVYNTTNGRKPGAWLCGSAVIGNMLRNTEIAGLILNTLGVNPTVATREQLNAVLAAHGIAPFVVNDDLFMVDGTATRAIPANRIVAVPQAGDPLGSSFWTVTAEALELVETGHLTLEESPGIVAMNWRNPDPVGIWTKAVGIGLPFLANPNLTFGATVG